MRTTLFLALSITLFSCHKRETPSESELRNSILTTDSLINISATTNREPETDTIKYDTLVFPNISEEDYIMKTLQTGSHHGDEVPDNTTKLSWMGLFKGKDGYYIAKTGVSVTNVHDPVIDETEKEKTGRQVKTTIKDTAIILVSGCDYITEHKVKHITPAKTEIPPGETLSFNFKGKDYSLQAAGGSYKRDNDVVIYNYKLSITGEKDGKTIATLLIANPNLYDGYAPNFIFIGDLDGDDIPDLIIDDSQENEESPTLYLSKPAGEKELLKPVSVHTYVGC